MKIDRSLNFPWYVCKVPSVVRFALGSGRIVTTTGLTCIFQLKHLNFKFSILAKDSIWGQYASTSAVKVELTRSELGSAATKAAPYNYNYKFNYGTHA